MVNDFLNNVFDEYVKEYGAYCNKNLESFEDRLELLKREIQIE